MRKKQVPQFDFERSEPNKLELIFPTSIFDKPHLFAVHHVGREINQGFYSNRRKNCPYVLLVYTIEGSISLTYKNKKQKLEPGTLAVILLQEESFLYMKDGYWKNYFICFDSALCNEMYNLIYEKCGYLIKNYEPNKLIGLINECLTTYQNGTYNEYEVSKKIYDILIDIIKNNSITADGAIEKAKTYIYNNFTHYISLDEIALYVNMSKYYFIKTFKKSMGMTPHEYINKCRIQMAERLIKETKLSNETIALHCGFSNPRNMYYHFKKQTNSTPKNSI